MNNPETRMQVAVIGVGRMGRHHARTYRALPQAELVAVVDPDADRAAAVADEYGCEALPDTAALLERFPGLGAVSVATPTRHHHAAAAPLLARRIACLVEKPLAPTFAEAQRLAELAGRCGAVLQVGHTERFNPAVRAVSSLGITPRFLEVDRVSPMTFRSLDVGVVMDMMIHDLDIVLTLVGSPIQRVDASGVAVLSEYEDVANCRIAFESGCVANLTASRLALKTERKLRLFSESAYVSLDYQRRSGVVIRKSANDTQLAAVREKLRAGADLSALDYSDLVQVDELTMDVPEGERDPLTAELTSFLSAVRDGSAPAVDATAGSAAIDAAERVVHAIASHPWPGTAPAIR